ncbi:MAG: DEAD/DEAH box helicase family protein [Planctomycetaceae bacterium]
MLTLRPYQQEAVAAVYQHLRERDDNPCVVIPTGGGKTPVMATICRDAVVTWSGRVLIVAHVKELLAQSAEKLRVVCPEVNFGIYSAGLKRRDTQAPVIVAGIQSIYKRACELGPFDLILVDEAHLIPADGEGMYQQFLAEAQVVNPHVRVIGLTATPYRLKSGMICTPDHFLNEVCYEVGVRELIVQSYLSPLVTKAGVTRADTSTVHVRGGEFVSSEVEDLMDQDELVKAACQEIIACTEDRRSVLIFTTGIKHGRHVQDVLQRQHGVECGFVSGESPTAERDATLKQFRDGKLRYLSNVNVLTTGFDAPDIDCVVMLRPTMSAGLYYQMVGRGFRLHPGKQNCLVLDFGGNVLRHGPVDAIRVEERTNGDGAAPAKECPICRAVIAAGYGTCPQCGYEFPPPKRQQHEPQATEAAILSDQVSNATYEVRDISWSVHQKRDAPEDAPKSMRVDYRLGLSHWQSEWICFEHTGFARQKAEAWWQQRSNDSIPETAEQAVTLAEAGALCQTNTITVRSVPGERFDRIAGYDLDTKPEPVPSFNHVDLDDLPF